MFAKLGMGRKIGIGFTVTLMLLAVVAGVAWQALGRASAGFTEYRGLARDTNLTGRLQANMLMVRMNVKDFIITSSDKDVQEYNEYVEKTRGFLTEAQEEIQHPERAALIDNIEQYVQDYEAGFENVRDLAAKRSDLVNNTLNTTGPQMEKNLTEIMISADQDKDPQAAFRAGLAMRHLLLARLYVVKFLDANEQAAVDRVKKELGLLDEQLTVLHNEVENPKRRQLLETVIAERSQYGKAFDKLTETIFARNKIIHDTLDRLGPVIAKDAEDVKLSVKADQDKLGPAVQASNDRATTIVIAVALTGIVAAIILAIVITRSITKPIGRIMNGLDEGARQMREASTQVATSSQQMAEGAGEQASSLEETSSALEEMAAMTRNNANNAKEANELSDQARQAAQTGDQTMARLNDAMTGINESSEKISKIIKVIEEIAFQTNLLALNAAVEAARAGEHGKGFAVVAEEVRNLAQRAAQAARETTGLIEESVARAREGTDVAGDVAEALSRIVGDVAKVTELINGIARASEEQAQGVDQVNTAVSQMDKVTQQNAAGAEESASAAQQLSAQAMSVNRVVDELGVLVGGAAARRRADADPATDSSPRHRPHARVTHEPSNPVAYSHDSAGQDDATNLQDF